MRCKKAIFPGVEVEPTYRNGEVVEDKYKGEYSDQVYTNEIIKMIDSKKKTTVAFLRLRPIHRYSPATASA